MIPPSVDHPTLEGYMHAYIKTLNLQGYDNVRLMHHAFFQGALSFSRMVHLISEATTDEVAFSLKMADLHEEMQKFFLEFQAELDAHQEPHEVKH